MWFWKKCILHPMRSVRITFVLVLSVMMIAWILVIRSLFNESFKSAPSKKTVREVRSVLLLRTKGCNVTTVEVFSQNEESRTPRCATKPPRTISNITTLWLRNPEDKCCFRTLQPHERIQNRFRFGEKCVDIPAEGYRVLNDKKIGPEFVSVRCESTGQRDFHAFVPLRDDLEVRDWKKMNVLILGFSGLNTISFPRLLSRTWSVLLRDLNGAYIRGYSKITNASFPSICTALTGLDKEDYQSRCMSHGMSTIPRLACPWAWSFFAKNGYRTMLVEDWPRSGLFNVAASAAPHYWPTHFFDAENRDIQPSWSVDDRECLGSRSQTQFLASYMTSFGVSFASSNTPFFAVVWSHALKTNISTASHVDETFADALRVLLHFGALSNTAVLLTSEPKDHELPALVVRFPYWFQEKFPQQLKHLHSNQGRLTTPRDVYSTFADIVNDPLVSFQDFRGFEALNGVSLLQMISPLRTCKDAGVDADECPCHN